MSDDLAPSTTPLARADLWHNRGFLLLWGGQSISQVGSQVTIWALPLTAVYALKAGAGQMGLLLAAGTAPYLLFGLGAGVWADRVRRRPLMIAADVGRALLLGSIPLAAWRGWLAMPQLYVVAFGAGMLRVLFDVAYQSFLPSLVARDQLPEGNAKLEASNATAGIVGPGLAGMLVQFFSGPLAILVDAVSFVISAFSLACVQVSERTDPFTVERTNAERRPRAIRAIRAIHDTRAGIAAVLGHPMLRPLTIATAFFGFFDSLLIAVYILYLTRTLSVPAALVGLIFMLGGAGGLIGALLARFVTRALGLGWTLLASLMVAGIAELVIALARGPLPLALLLVIAGEAGVQGGDVIFGINSVSLRQALVPDWLQGRVNATVRVIAAGAATLGAVLGGVLGSLYGLRATVVIAGCGTLLAFLWVYWSPVKRLRGHPVAPDERAFAPMRPH